jgi:N-acetylneuraminic acid mutarotase
MKKLKSLFKEKRNRNANELEGEWVAFANGKIVAHEGTLKKLMKKVKKCKGNQKKSVMLMPKRIEGNYII